MHGLPGLFCGDQTESTLPTEPFPSPFLYLGLWASLIIHLKASEASKFIRESILCIYELPVLIIGLFLYCSDISMLFFFPPCKMSVLQGFFFLCSANSLLCVLFVSCSYLFLSQFILAACHLPFKLGWGASFVLFPIPVYHPVQ